MTVINGKTSNKNREEARGRKDSYFSLVVGNCLEAGSDCLPKEDNLASTPYYRGAECRKRAGRLRKYIEFIIHLLLVFIII